VKFGSERPKVWTHQVMTLIIVGCDMFMPPSLGRNGMSFSACGMECSPIVALSVKRIRLLAFTESRSDSQLPSRLHSITRQ
jgi:hypothetical protein